MQADGLSRRDLIKNVAAFGVAAAPVLANAEIDYANVPFLGGSDKIDINNANVRVYTKVRTSTRGGRGESGRGLASCLSLQV